MSDVTDLQDYREWREEHEREWREEQEEERSWPALFRGWARTLRHEADKAARGDESVAYGEMAFAVSEALTEWADEMESADGGGRRGSDQ